jgi:putative CocE/NonD family hydrolase
MTALASQRPAAPRLPLTIYRDLEIPMRDGTILRADLWLPNGNRRCPVLLQRTPYDKSFAPVAHGRLAPASAVARGYGVMIQDVRGRFASEGAFEPFAQERGDGVDTVAWIARQPFSNGRVAMYGASYPGAVQLLAAAGGAPALSAMIADVTTIDFHGWMYQNGAFQLGFALSWAIGLAGEALARRERTGVNVERLRARLDALAADVWSAYRQLPVSDQPLLDELVPAFGAWLAHPVRDAFWDRLSTPGDLERITVPALHITGWHDVFVRGTLAQFTRLQQLGRARQRLLVGPWGHGGWGDAVGELIFGPGVSRYELDMSKLHLDFCDRLVADAADDSGAPVRLFTMGVNRWRDEDLWPPAAVRSQRLYLRADGRLTAAPPAPDEQTRSFRYDPRDPVPTMGGATFMPGHEASIALGPRDQRPLHSRGDVVLYTGEPLARPIEVTGNVSLTLHAATSAPDTDWTAKLLDVYPDGRALGITDGIVRARFSQTTPGLLEAGRPHRFSIDAGPTSIVFAAGHRIAVEISSSNFPRYDRNANSPLLPAHARDADIRVAEQTLHHDGARPSFLELPVRDR